MEGRWILILMLISTGRGRSIPCFSNHTSIPCSADYISNATECHPLVLSMNYPDLYNLTYGPPDRPGDLLLPVFEKYYPNYGYYSGVNVTIKPPKTASIHFVKGFEIRYNLYKSGTVKEKCIVLYVTPHQMGMNEKNTMFSVEVWPMASGLYTFQVYSLPRPIGDGDTMDMFRQSAATISKFGYKGNTSSNMWYTTISYTVLYPSGAEQGSIRYHFVRSPVFSFPAFSVQLFMANVYYAVRNTTVSWQAALNTHIFSSLIPGTYEIKITPIDPQKLHACKDSNGFMTSCTTTSADNITVGEVPPSSSNEHSTTSMPLTSTVIGQESESATASYDNTTMKPDFSNIILASTLGTCLALLLLSLLAYFAYTRQFKKQEKLEDNGNNDEPKSIPNCFGFQQENEKYKKEGGHSVPLDKRARSMVIVHTVDNKFHQDAIEKLGDFLQGYFNITVYVEPCSCESNIEKALILAKSAEMADIFMFVCSPTNYKLYMSSSRNERNGVQQMFKYLLNSNTDNDQQKRNYVLVGFDYPVQEQFMVHEGFHPKHFSLMSDMAVFLEHLALCAHNTPKHNSHDHKNLKSKRNALEKAVALAIKFYEENVMKNKGVHVYEGSQAFSSKWEKLESISNVLDERIIHLEMADPEYDFHMTRHCPVNDELPYHFDPPSETVSISSTLAMQREIQCLNQRNQNHPDKLYLHYENMDTDVECISMNSGKSV